MRYRPFPRTGPTALVLIALLGGCAGNDIPADAAPEDILAQAQEKLANEKYYDAAEAFEYFLRNHPGTAMTPLAKLRLGDARYGLGDYILAEGEFQQVVSDFPASPHVEEARYKIALCSYAAVLPYNRDQSETKRALRLFEEFVQDYPESVWIPDVNRAAADCRDRLAHGEYENGRFYQGRSRFKPASVEYKFIVQQYPETEWAPKAALSLAEMYSLRERWDDATSWYRRVVQDWPASTEATAAGEALTQIPASGGALSQLPGSEEGP